MFNKLSHDIAVAAEDAKNTGVSLDDLDAVMSGLSTRDQQEAKAYAENYKKDCLQCYS